MPLLLGSESKATKIVPLLDDAILVQNSFCPRAVEHVVHDAPSHIKIKLKKSKIMIRIKWEVRMFFKWQERAGACPSLTRMLFLVTRIIV